MNIVDSPSYIHLGIKCRPVISFSFLQDTHYSFVTAPHWGLQFCSGSLLIHILTKCSWPMLFATFLVLSFSHILTCHNLLSSHNNSVVLNTKHTKGSILGFTYNLSKQDTEVNLDGFLVYGELYREVRDAMARAILSDDTDELVVSLKV